MDPRSTYEVGRAAAERDVAREDRLIRAIGSVRLLIAAGAVGLVGALVWTALSPAAWGAVAGLGLVFVVLVIAHQRAFARRARAAAVKRFHDRGLDRLTGGWTAHLGDGSSFRAPDHPYSGDLDIFGPASLFQLLNVAETSFGERALAAALAQPMSRSQAAPPRAVSPSSADARLDDPGAVDGDRDDQAWLKELRARQVAVKELAAKVTFRERLSSIAHVVSSEKPDPTPFVDWAETAPPMGVSRVVLALSWLFPLCAVVSMAFGSMLGLPRGSWFVVILGELAFLAAHRAKTRPILAAASSREGSLARFRDVFEVIEGEAFEALPFRRLMDELSLGGASVTREMATLARIIGFVDARQNEVFRAFIGPILLWDFHCAVALDRWRARGGGRVRRWFGVLGELEALASLAGFAFDHPEHAWPDLDPAAGFEAVALGHPLLAASDRVDNDVRLPGPFASGTTERALVVTGSNMSGKSTLLRAVGVNAVLAMAGAPTCAKRLTVGRVSVATSMRVSDSLEAGISHFLAELKAIKRVVDLAGARPPVLFLLDEILHGTNSRERLIGARAILRSLIDLSAFGAVSTHDLGIAERVPELEGRVRNVHFEEQVDASGTMTFDYRLRDGVVQSSNALRLMRAVGLDVPESTS
jgi:hypothetical protein